MAWFIVIVNLLFVNQGFTWSIMRLLFWSFWGTSPKWATHRFAGHFRFLSCHFSRIVTGPPFYYLFSQFCVFPYLFYCSVRSGSPRIGVTGDRRHCGGNGAGGRLSTRCNSVLLAHAMVIIRSSLSRFYSIVLLASFPEWSFIPGTVLKLVISSLYCVLD